MGEQETNKECVLEGLSCLCIDFLLVASLFLPSILQHHSSLLFLCFLSPRSCLPPPTAHRRQSASDPSSLPSSPLSSTLTCSPLALHPRLLSTFLHPHLLFFSLASSPALPSLPSSSLPLPFHAVLCSSTLHHAALLSGSLRHGRALAPREYPHILLISLPVNRCRA